MKTRNFSRPPGRCRKADRPVCHSRPAAGVALVVTLIMLSVIAFMSITFLILTQRERGSVSVAANQTDAKLAADTALQRAQAEIMAPVLAFHNPDAYGLVISTNYINTNGFNPNLPDLTSPTNVNFDYLKNGGTLSVAQQRQNLANLQYNPRPPVYIVTNAATGGSEFRFYLDLNRNGRYDTNGYQAVTDNTGNTTGNFAYFPGDPEWIGILERPELPHSGTNHFVARYAYIVVPTGQTLDVNYIHNQAGNRDFNNGNDRFTRNEGVGSYEINLAAFLRDLNTNFWGYTYNVPSGFANTGTGFQDAQSIVEYRYNNNYNDLTKTVTQLFPGNGVTAFNSDQIDRYADGPLMTTVATNVNDIASSGFRWAGADNPTHYFTLQDLFNAQYLGNFSNRVWSAGTNLSSYDRSTYYRLLSQLGTDSAGDNRLNLDYVNVDNTGKVVPDLQTNFVAWQPVNFFTNMANRLLSDLNLSITNIPIYPVNDYTPAVHRLLQLAANLYDATTTNVFPSVFSPAFSRLGAGTNMQVWISGYAEETDASVTNRLVLDLTDPFSLQQIIPMVPGDTTHVISGIPLVVGAKKGLPNFNEFALENALTVTRKLEFRRNNTNSPVNATNQMYVFNIASKLGVEAWNSYSNSWNLAARPLRMVVAGDVGVGVSMTNEQTGSGSVIHTNFFPMSNNLLVPGTIWTGYTNDAPAQLARSFQIPLSNSVTFLQTNMVYLQSAIGFESFPNLNPQPVSGIFLPKWYVNLRTRLRYALVDTTQNRIIDYVNLDSAEQPFDLTYQLADNKTGAALDGSAAGGWYTNRLDNSNPPNPGKPTTGLWNQILVGRGDILSPDWNSYQKDPAAGDDVAKAVQFFRNTLYYPTIPNTKGYAVSNVFYAPYVATRTLYQHVSWQANDPLVHYTKSDLTDLAATNVFNNPTLFTTNSSTLGTMNTRYKPWGGNPVNPVATDPNNYNLALKDPLVTRSDGWDFPTNKLPNVGWIGRVHRGTPWQTVYLKSPEIGADTNNSPNDWQKWTGNANRADAYYARPAADRLLFDHLTTAPNDNAARGRLSVNQTNLAAWSAVLSGVIALTNDTLDANVSASVKPAYSPVVIDPAGNATGVNVPVQRMVDSINATRAGTNFNGSFRHLGDILAVPELTVGAQTNYAGTYPNGYWTNASPFLNLGDPASNPSIQEKSGLSDAAYERIPQQIMSLLRGGEEPRFVVYAYGQSLKPADRSIIQVSGFSGMVTNYQITGEVATRSVVRIEGGTTNAHAVVESYNYLPPE